MTSLTVRRSTMWGDVYDTTVYDNVQDQIDTSVDTAVNGIVEEYHTQLTFFNDTPNFYTIAHRGCNFTGSEGSLYAYGRCLEKGLRDIEGDMQLTSDGHIVLSHDANAHFASGDVVIASSTLTVLKDSSRKFNPVLGSRVDSTQQIIELDEFFQFVKNAKCRIWLEAKVSNTHLPLIEAIRRNGINFNRVCVSYFTSVTGYDDEIVILKSYGILTCLQFGTTSSTVTADSNVASCQQLNVDFLTSDKGSSDAVVAIYTASDFPVILYTVNTRQERDEDVIDRGCVGLYSDDAFYLSRSKPASTDDQFQSLTWNDGMRTLNSSTAVVSRGEFKKDGEVHANQPLAYGFSFSTSANWTLQGYMCPVTNPVTLLPTTNFVIHYGLIFTTGTTSAGWGGIGITDDTYYDHSITDNNATSPPEEECYLIFQRLDGTLELFHRSGTTSTNIAETSGTTLVINTVYHYRVEVNATEISLSRVVAAYSDTPVASQTVTFATNTVRGSYVYLGRKNAAVWFTYMRVTPQ